MRNFFSGFGAAAALGLVLALFNLLAFGGLLDLRIQQLDPSVLTECLRFGPRAQQCAEWRMHAHLAEPHWLARQFTVYTLLALSVTFLFGWLRPDGATGRALGGALIACAVILQVADPGRLPAVATLAGCLLGALIAARLHRRRKPA